MSEVIETHVTGMVRYYKMKIIDAATGEVVSSHGFKDESADFGITEEDMLRSEITGLTHALNGASTEMARQAAAREIKYIKKEKLNRLLCHAAAAYCEARTEYLDLKRQIKDAQCELLKEGDDGTGFAYLSGTPCWQEQVHIPPDDFQPLEVRDYCQTCVAAAELVARRRRLGRQMGGLSRRMTAAWKKYEAGDE